MSGMNINRSGERSLLNRIRALEERATNSAPKVVIDLGQVPEADLEQLASIRAKLEAGVAIESLSTEELRLLVDLPKVPT